MHHKIIQQFRVEIQTGKLQKIAADCIIKITLSHDITCFECNMPIMNFFILILHMCNIS